MKTVLSTIPILVLLCIGVLGNARADSASYLSHKGALLEQLDSIDMEKQIRKRKGLSLEELETKSLLIKDSIASLKKDFHPADEKPKASEEARDHHRKLFPSGRHLLPDNGFDWIVFVFAVIALIAGAILCIGLFSMIWKTITRKKKTPLKTMRENLSLRDERANGGKTALQKSEPEPEITENALDALKKRMSSTSTDAPSPAGLPSASPEPANSLLGSSKILHHETAISQKESSQPSGAHEARASGIKEAIIKASSEGASVVEISKRFHVSADQVSLILRVWHQENSHQES
jgi:hypothetical protein